MGALIHNRVIHKYRPVLDDYIRKSAICSTVFAPNKAYTRYRHNVRLIYPTCCSSTHGASDGEIAHKRFHEQIILVPVTKICDPVEVLFNYPRIITYVGRRTRSASLVVLVNDIEFNAIVMDLLISIPAPLENHWPIRCLLMDCSLEMLIFITKLVKTG